MDYQAAPNVPQLINQAPQTINSPQTIQSIQSQGQAAPKLLRPDGSEFYRPVPLKENVLDPNNFLKTAPEVPKPSVGAQIGSGALKAVGVAAVGYGGFVDYQNGIAQGESQFRSGTNAIAGMGGAIAGGAAGSQLGAAVGAAVGAPFAGVGAIPGGAIGGFIGGGIGSFAGSGIAGWLSDRALDLFGGPKGIPNPNGPSGNPFSPQDPFGAPKPPIPQPTAQNPGPPPGGGGVGMPKGNPANPNTGAPTNPMLPWLPDWKPPRMPWDPPVPGKPTDPKKPGKPGNPGAPDPGKPKPVPTPATFGNPGTLYKVTVRRENPLSNPRVSEGSAYLRGRIGFPRQIDQGAGSIWGMNQNVGADGKGGDFFIFSSSSSKDEGTQRTVKIEPASQTPENTPKKAPPQKGKPSIPTPRGTLTPPSQPSAQNSPGAPQSPQSPGFTPSVNPSSPGNLNPFMGGNQGGFVPGLYKNPNYTPPKNDGTPQKKNDAPATKPETAPSRSPSAMGEPTLTPAPSTSPAVNQPGVNTPQPWTNPFFAPSSSGGGSTVISPEVNPGKLNTGELNKGELNTGDQTGATKWNPETKKYEPTRPGVTDPSQIKKPSTDQNPANPAGSNSKTSFKMPEGTIPSIPTIPAASKIPKGAIPEPITNPKPENTSGACRYNPDETEKIQVKKFKGCSLKSNGEKDYFENVGISVPVAAAAAWKMMLDNQADLLALQCTASSGGGFAIPEAWAVRRGTERPQLVIVYAEIFGSGKLSDSRWSVTVPHYRGTRNSKISAPRYKRGNWNGQLTLNDGSTIVVNADSSQECKRAINKLKILVPFTYRSKNGKAIKPRVVDNPNIDFKRCNVVPVTAHYYATGQKNLAPTWSQSLRKK